jgi:hypothetical protein
MNNVYYKGSPKMVRDNSYDPKLNSISFLLPTCQVVTSAMAAILNMSADSTPIVKTSKMETHP